MDTDFELKIQTQIGTIGIHWNPLGQLTRLRWIDSGQSNPAPSSLSPAIPPVPQKICSFLAKLNAYFESGEPLGEVQWDLLDTRGWSPFQRRVYAAITAIPHGDTRSYGWVASRLQNPFACRAVGQALRRNPLMILVPCHRVVPTVGGLGGFMGQDDPGQPELQVKRALLRLEDSFRSPAFSFISTEADVLDPSHLQVVC